MLLGLALTAGIGCPSPQDNDDQTTEEEPPDKPDNPDQPHALSRRVILETKGGKIASTELWVWDVEEQRWEVKADYSTPVPTPGVGAGAKASSLSGSGGTSTQDAIGLPSMALFTGGVAERATYASTTALLYNHATEEWTGLQMLQARVEHTSTTLLDNRVLIVGGWDGDISTPQTTALASAEVFDPQDNSFQFTGSLNVARMTHAAARLPDGRVLITGGSDTDGNSLASAELYDPGTGTFALTGSMLTARTAHAAVTLNDGRVLIVGSNGEQSCEVFDPATETFSAVGSTIGFHGYGLTATKLQDGRVLVIGGLGSPDSGWEISADVEVFDPTTNAFTALDPLAPGRHLHSAVLADDGTVLVCGGMTADGDILSACLIFDPVTNAFSAAPDMPRVNSDFVGVYLERPE